jgi:hypothetical protein
MDIIHKALYIYTSIFDDISVYNAHASISQKPYTI